MPISGSNTTIYEISPGLISTGQGLPFVSTGDTVLAVSTDDENFTTVPTDGSMVTVDGSYLSFAVDANGDLTTTPNQSVSSDPNQTLINDVNANDGASTPLNDSLYYEVSDGNGDTSVYQYTFDLGDTGFSFPNMPPYSTAETTTVGSTIDIGGAAVLKSLSSDGTYGGADPSTYMLSASISVYDFTNNTPDGTLSVNPATSGGGGIISYSGDDSTVTIFGTIDQVDADLSSLTYTAFQTGTDSISISTTDGPTPTATSYFVGSIVVNPAGTAPTPMPVANSTSTIYEVSTNSYSSGQGLPFLTGGDTVVGVSADDVNFTPVPNDGTTATVNGAYLSFAVDQNGDITTSLYQSGSDSPNQSVIDAINANDTGSMPLSDSVYYEVTDGSGNTVVDQYTFDLGDTGFSAPNTQPYSAPETTTQGTTIDIGGPTVSKALSSDGTYGGMSPSTYTLSVSIGVFDFNTQAADGTVSVDPTVSGGGGMVTYDGGGVTILGTLDQINADLSTLTYTAVNTGTDAIIISDIDGSTPSANSIIGSIHVDQAATCFCPGTLILAETGETPVEALRIGDLVVTGDGSVTPVKWIGRRSYVGAVVASMPLVLPICLKAGALAGGLPRQDLWVSPGHAILVDGCLVPAWRLVNGVSIVQAEAIDAVTYYHVELDRHAVLFANGAAVESFLDDGCRDQFQNAADFHARYPDAPTMTPLAARLEEGFMLQRLQERVAERAGVFPLAEPAGLLRGFVDIATSHRVSGWAQDSLNPEEPVALEVLVGDQPVVCVLANAYRSDLRQFGLGSGCHAFDIEFDAVFSGPVSVRRIGDDLPLERTTDAAAAGEKLAA
jgi:hypothetical protein